MDKNKLKVFLAWMVIGACLTLGIVLASLVYVKMMNEHHIPPVAPHHFKTDKVCSRNICEMPVRRLAKKRDLEI